MALNPVRFTGQVAEEFRRYQLTADPRLAEQAKALLGAGPYAQSPLTKGPYVSLARAFQEGAPLQSLVDEGLVHPALPGVAEFPGLFAHQDETLRSALAGRHVLVSTGTGSGKTESFLYPIIDRCLRMRDAGEPAGVTAVLVYPMNALAADQRDRLRTLLAGTGITYGMYVGSTPRRPADTDVTQLREGEGREALLAAWRRRKANDPDVVPYEECASEQEIRERRPRILITNANQLELLLTRQRDFELFTGAPLRFVVLDEAHTYAGATGAEVACLVRRLRAFAGKAPDEVTCIATSATIVDPQHGAEVGPEFLARLCGVPSEAVDLVTERYADLRWPQARSIPPEPADPDAVLARVLEALGSPPPPDAGGPEGDEEAGVDRDALSKAVEALTGARPHLPEGGVAEALFTHLAAMDPVRLLAKELEHARELGEVTQRIRDHLGRQGQPPESTTAEVLAYLALGAFARRGDAPLLRPKLHLFVRGLEGAVVTFEGDPPAPTLHFSAGDALAAGDVERLPAAVFPVSVCRTCGQHYFTTHLDDYAVEGREPVGGRASGESAYWCPVADPEADGAQRVRFTDWVLAEGDPDDEESAGNGQAKTSSRLADRRVEAHLCVACGTVHRGAEPVCANPECARPGPLARIFLILEPKGFRCLGCGAQSGSGSGRAYEPIRPLRATTVADVHILAQEMVSAAGSDDERHLLVFADNRQDAAFQAGWMRDHARRYRLRYLVLDVLRALEAAGGGAGGPVSVGDLHAELVRRLRADRDLARAVAPEAFDSAESESYGRAERGRLERLLRIHVLRELATSYAQRDGLERWGQLRVIYAGLRPDEPRVRELAGELDMTPQALCDGVGALLDTWRRGRLLHDAQEPIFERWWGPGSEEILRGLLPSGFADVRPVGIKLERQGGDADKWVRTVISSRGRTSAVDFVRKWGVEDPRSAAERIWELVRALDLVTGVRLVGGNGGPLGGSAGANQVDVARLGLVRQHERHVCSVCRRVHARPTPAGACTKMHCQGTVQRADPPADDYNISLLSRPFAMVAAEEHTAQVPFDVRERIEKEFKRRGGTVNTLVASPTLELGVDIGALDLVLCRNVPPTPANYWQRVGRAGRRRRMAVVLVYCRRAVHDAYFFAQPEKLLGAPLRPPRFNLKNDVLVRKHVHATVLSELLRLAQADDATRAVLEQAVPQYVRDYLFEGEEDRYRTAPADVSGLGRLIDTHRALLVEAVERVFAAGWPSEAAAEVAYGRLGALVAGMPGALQGIVDGLHRRLTWVVDTQRRLLQAAAGRPLTPDEERQRDRCEDYVRSLKERQVRTYTLSVLAGEGFLPGYGLYDGGISAFPGRRGGGARFELSRTQAVAVREFVPGNLLYANRGRYRTARYHFPLDGQGQRTESYLADFATGFVTTEGTRSGGYGDTTPVVLPGLPIADVDLASQGYINDEETERFQVPVTMLGMARSHRRGGTAWTFGERAVHHVLGQGLRLVNAGPADRVRAGEPGYPVCVVCGATRSPYASPKELADFVDWHAKHCGRAPEWLALTANVVADALHVQDLDGQGDAANLGEALRLGASQVLEMEPEDLQTLPVPTAGGGHDLYVYDPMPGGSGLLTQIIERWDEIVGRLQAVLGDCPGGCETSCYSCLRTGRNVFWHRFLDRERALELLDGMGTEPARGHELQALEDASFGGPAATTHAVEDRLEAVLRRAGLEGFVGQHEVAIGAPYERTVPDFAYVDEQVAVYLDGLSGELHGSAERQKVDTIVRDQLEDLGWKVVVVAASHLDDPVALRAGLRRIARALRRREVAEAIAASDDWMHEAATNADGGASVTVVSVEDAQPYVRHVPLYSIRAAAGRFLENAEADEEGWVEAPGALREGMFAVRVEGVSMEPTIPDGSLALFRADPAGAPVAGSRQGQIVLAALHEASDPEGGGSYSIKRYRSEKAADEENGWRHTRVVLESLNPAVAHIEIGLDQDVDVIAMFESVLGTPTPSAAQR